LQVSVSIVPTGQQLHPAARSSGVLTIYNGSFLVQQLPAGFILTTQNGAEVITNQAVTIPAAVPPTLGIATVTAHAAAGGVGGNVPTLAVDQTYGSSLYLKNLDAFTGGRDAYTSTYATDQDRTTALTTSRADLRVKQPAGLTTGPCSEKANEKALVLSVVWSCQYVSYTAPKGMQVLSVRVQGATVVLVVREAVQPRDRGQYWR
jgi:hypothetical protein